MTEDEDLKEFFARMPKRKPPTLKECIERWSKRTQGYLQWEKIGIDDYLLALYEREKVEELLGKEDVSEELKEKLDVADKKFIELTRETEKSLISTIETKDNETKKKYWFAYRLLSAHYDEWLLYAHF